MTILNEAILSDGYWREDVGTTIYILNKGQRKINSNKNSYELWFGRDPSVKYFKVFGSKFYIKRFYENLENLMLYLRKVSFLDMLLPRKHTKATILDYIRLLRVQMLSWMT
jgi:hypothetical protein